MLIFANNTKKTTTINSIKNSFENNYPKKPQRKI